MGKVFLYLKKSIVPIIFIVVLLVIQAMGDLALPDYVAKIVNVGIAQSGIESPVPESLTKETLDDMKETLFWNSDELKLVNSGFEEVVINEIPAYSLKSSSPELDELMKKSVSVYSFSKAFSDGDYDAALTGDSSLDMTKIDFSKSIVEQVYSIASEKMGETVLDQAGISFLASEYKTLGINKGTPYILSAGIKMLGIALMIAASTIIVTLLASRVAAVCARDMRRDVFGKVMNFSSMEFNEFSSTSLITRCTNDIQQVQILVVMVLRMVLYAPILGIGALLKVIDTGSMTWIIAVAVLSILSLIVILMVVAMPKFKILQKLVDKLNLVSREILTGLPVIRAFSREKFEENRFDKANTELTRTNLFVNRVMAFMMPLMMLIMNGTSLLIVWVGADAIEKSQIQVGDIMAFSQYAMQIIISFLMLSMLSILLPRALISAGRISDVLKAPISIENEEQTQEFPDDVKGEVEYRNVSFKYPGADGYVLKDISFKIGRGQTLAIIGSTGCGKSTLINLIPRFFDVTDGEVLIDGVDVRKAKLSDLRNKLGYVPQKGMLFSGTIASNIGYGVSEPTDEEIEFAAKIAQSEDFINEKPAGYDSEISQGGTNVSGGQRQRLSIARAIAKNPEIFIFDDSFSALDFKTDSALRKALGEIEGKTKIIVAQRISTVLNADKILVLEDGKIVGEGTHKELIENCPSYVQIAQSQLSKEEIEL